MTKRNSFSLKVFFFFDIHSINFYTVLGPCLFWLLLICHVFPSSVLSVLFITEIFQPYLTEFESSFTTIFFCFFYLNVCSGGWGELAGLQWADSSGTAEADRSRGQVKVAKEGRWRSAGPPSAAAATPPQFQWGKFFQFGPENDSGERYKDVGNWLVLLWIKFVLISTSGTLNIILLISSCICNNTCLSVRNLLPACDLLASSVRQPTTPTRFQTWWVLLYFLLPFPHSGFIHVCLEF